MQINSSGSQKVTSDAEASENNNRYETIEESDVSNEVAEAKVIENAKTFRTYFGSLLTRCM